MTTPLEIIVSNVRAGFRDAIGSTLLTYETAEIRGDDGRWSPWTDLPIRLITSRGNIAVSWSGFDTLWIRNDRALPFDIEGAEVRWVNDSLAQLNGALGSVIAGVVVGRGQMAIAGKELEVWTRLVVHVGNFWLEIYNALDENGYALHDKMPSGDFLKCL